MEGGWYRRNLIRPSLNGNGSNGNGHAPPPSARRQPRKRPRPDWQRDSPAPKDPLAELRKLVAKAEDAAARAVEKSHVAQASRLAGESADFDRWAESVKALTGHVTHLATTGGPGDLHGEEADSLKERLSTAARKAAEAMDRVQAATQ